MSGLSVLYAKEAAREVGWTRISPKNRTKRLREAYWARPGGRDISSETVHRHGTHLATRQKRTREKYG